MYEVIIIHPWSEENRKNHKGGHQLSVPFKETTVLCPSPREWARILAEAWLYNPWPSVFTSPYVTQSATLKHRPLGLLCDTKHAKPRNAAGMWRHTRSFQIHSRQECSSSGAWSNPGSCLTDRPHTAVVPTTSQTFVSLGLPSFRPRAMNPNDTMSHCPGQPLTAVVVSLRRNVCRCSVLFRRSARIHCWLSQCRAKSAKCETGVA